MLILLREMEGTARLARTVQERNEELTLALRDALQTGQFPSDKYNELFNLLAKVCST